MSEFEKVLNNNINNLKNKILKTKKLIKLKTDEIRELEDIIVHAERRIKDYNDALEFVEDVFMFEVDTLEDKRGLLKLYCKAVSCGKCKISKDICHSGHSSLFTEIDVDKALHLILKDGDEK